MKARVVLCGHCGLRNVVAGCPTCQRSFVITKAHLQQRDREFEAEAIQDLAEDFEIPTCDFCSFMVRGEALQAISGGLRQRTCPACHTEFLTEHGL